MKQYFSRQEIVDIAKANNHSLHFQMNYAKNTGRYFEAAYILYGSGKMDLFAKYSRFEGGFALCNEFAKLAPNNNG